MVPATISWFAALTVCPEPGGPTSTTVVPIVSKMDFTSSKSARTAPTMIDSVASVARSWPRAGVDAALAQRQAFHVG
jgi:hypothetical protein